MSELIVFGYTRDRSLIIENTDDWQEAEDQFGIYWFKYPPMIQPERKRYSQKEAQEAGCVSAEQCDIAARVNCTLADVADRCSINHRIQEALKK